MIKRHRIGTCVIIIKMRKLIVHYIHTYSFTRTYCTCGPWNSVLTQTFLFSIYIWCCIILGGHYTYLTVARNWNNFNVFEPSNTPTIRLHLTTFFRKEIGFLKRMLMLTEKERRQKCCLLESRDSLFTNLTFQSKIKSKKSTRFGYTCTCTSTNSNTEHKQEYGSNLEKIFRFHSQSYTCTGCSICETIHGDL